MPGRPKSRIKILREISKKKKKSRQLGGDGPTLDRGGVKFRIGDAGYPRDYGLRERLGGRLAKGGRTMGEKKAYKASRIQTDK